MYAESAPGAVTRTRPPASTREGMAGELSSITQISSESFYAVIYAVIIAIVACEIWSKVVTVFALAW